MCAWAVEDNEVPFNSMVRKAIIMSAVLVCKARSLNSVMMAHKRFHYAFGGHAVNL